MSISTVITKLANVLKKLAERDALRAAAAQARYKKQAAARVKVIAAERARLEARAYQLCREQGVAQTASAMGSDKFAKQESAARTLSRQLGNIAG